MTLARTAASTGDAIEIESLYQHAEHYFRLTRELEGAVRLIQPNATKAKGEALHAAS